MNLTSVSDSELVAEMMRRGFLEEEVVLEVTKLPKPVHDALIGVERRYLNGQWQWVQPTNGRDWDITESVDTLLEPHFRTQLRLASQEALQAALADVPKAASK